MNLPLSCISTSAQTESPLKVFVLAGQSNMLGYRSLVEDLPANLRAPAARALFFDSETWIAVAPGKTEATGFGPEISFAHHLEKLWHEPFGIIKLSNGGMDLAVNWSPQGNDNLYVMLLEKVRRTQASRPIEIVGTLWMQGESDAMDAEKADAYAENLQIFIARLRKEFGNPEMIFLCGRVNPPFEGFPWGETVRKAQESCPADHYRMINCDDLEKGPDALHYTTKGVVEMGRRFAEGVWEELSIRSHSAGQEND